MAPIEQRQDLIDKTIDEQTSSETSSVIDTTKDSLKSLLLHDAELWNSESHEKDKMAPIDTSQANTDKPSSETSSVTDATDSAKDSLKSLLHDVENHVECIDNAIKCGTLRNKICGKNCAKEANKRRMDCGTVTKAVLGFLLLAMSISSFIFTPLDFLLWEKLNMRPGLPPFEWWADPPDEVIMSVYVFNVTNHERFMAGLDEKINLQEIGPIVYLEKLQHYNITFNENSTMTYTAKRSPIFLPNRNHVNFNDTIVVPNLAVLGLASYLYNSPFFVKIAFSMMVSSKKSEFFSIGTIEDYLWNYRDPVLATSRDLAPGLVPVDNMGVLHRMYEDFTDVVTVLIGQRWGHNRFFELDRFRGQTQLPGFNSEICPDRVFNSTEGVMYSQRIEKNDTLYYWRKSVCKVMPLFFDKEFLMSDIPVYRFNLSEQVHDRVTNKTDCYDTVPKLEQGLSDASKCYFDFPMVISFPHFYTGVPAPDKYVTGLKPNASKHNSYAVVEPKTGTPMHSVARMQSNLRVLDLSSFGKSYDKFSGLVIPMFWAEYNQEDLPAYIKNMLYFTAVVLPPLQMTISILGVVLSTFIILSIFCRNKLRKLPYFDRTKSKNNIYKCDIEGLVVPKL